MPTRKASELEAGLVLLDPDGHLYEIISVHDDNTGFVHVWLWPDTSKEPSSFQTFERDELINFISHLGRATSSTEETAIIPAVDLMAEVNVDEPDANGAAE